MLIYLRVFKGIEHLSASPLSDIIKHAKRDNDNYCDSLAQAAQSLFSEWSERENFMPELKNSVLNHFSNVLHVDVTNIEELRSLSCKLVGKYILP